MPEDAPTFDLQSHSIHSDGALAPSDVVASAAEAGVELLALSDHDSVNGVAEALDAGERHGIGVVRAVEVSAVDGIYDDLHILGYGVDHQDSELLEALQGYRDDRELRAERMADALRELGYELDDAPLQARREAGKTIGRPHLSQAVVSHPANAKRLQAEGLAELSAFLEAYLIEGKPGFRSRTRPDVAEAIEVIHAAGGVAVWAHPFWDVKRPEIVLAAIDRFRASGLDGVECFYATFEREQAELLADRCQELGLLSTGSSDFHGPGHRLFSRFRAFSTYGREAMLGPIGA